MKSSIFNASAHIHFHTGHRPQSLNIKALNNACVGRSCFKDRSPCSHLICIRLIVYPRISHTIYVSERQQSKSDTLASKDMRLSQGEVVCYRWQFSHSGAPTTSPLNNSHFHNTEPQLHLLPRTLRVAPRGLRLRKQDHTRAISEYLLFHNGSSASSSDAPLSLTPGINKLKAIEFITMI